MSATADGGNDPKIEYSVRELLIDLRRELSRDLADMRSDMNTKLDNLFAKVDGKADRSEVAAVNAKVDLLDNRVQATEMALRERAQAREHYSQQASAKRSMRQWAIPTIVSALVFLVYVLQLLGVHG